MTTAHRFVSLSLLSAMALVLAPAASAQGFGQGRGHMGFGFGLGQQNSEVRTELEACKEEHQGDHDAMKTCADAVFEQYGIQRPERPEHPEISDEMHDELEACHDDNEGDREAAKACADAVFEASGIERPAMPPHRGRHMRMGQRNGGLFQSTDLRAELKACLDLDDNEELRQCVFGVRAQARANAQN
ncbi:MAG: hypothetical protein KC680_02220 [Candidatus Peregrinibacteria bacterium]|nr:hypothetical protein [Candidatus Peregrinibacteria bacterium]MCB9808071.1 hypothetical protein [Candidatus Peribacteria bacterium]